MYCVYNYLTDTVASIHRSIRTAEIARRSPALPGIGWTIRRLVGGEPARLTDDEHEQWHRIEDDA